MISSRMTSSLERSGTKLYRNVSFLIVVEIGSMLGRETDNLRELSQSMLSDSSTDNGVLSRILLGHLLFEGKTDHLSALLSPLG